jgi:hypothetical protein
MFADVLSALARRSRFAERLAACVYAGAGFSFRTG